MLGAILAGGESRRFGSDKSSALLVGETLLARAGGTLASVFEDVVIVSSSDTRPAPWSRVPDRQPGLGPLAGIEAALVRAHELGREGAFVLACDMPLVNASAVRAVLAALGDAWAAAPTGGRGVEPLCAAYRVQCLPAVTQALEARRLAVHELFAGVRGVTVALPARLFLNVNTPQDHARAIEVLREVLRREPG
jgi:FdhD protein